MSCKLYMQYQGSTIPLGKFKNIQKAMQFWELYVNSMKSNKNCYPKAIYVESKKGRG